MNIDDGAPLSSERKLTAVTDEKFTKEMAKNLLPHEIENIKEFVNKEIRGSEAKDIVKTFTKMFKDIKKPKLRKYLMQSVSNLPGPSLEMITDMII